MPMQISPISPKPVPCTTWPASQPAMRPTSRMTRMLSPDKYIAHVLWLPRRRDDCAGAGWAQAGRSSPLPLRERVPERRRSRARAGEGSESQAKLTPLPARLRYRSGSPPSPSRGEGKRVCGPAGDKMAAIRKDSPMPLSDTLKTLIRSAWDDGYPLLVATVGPLGPNIAPKGSMIAYDGEHLAWWERSKKGVLENLGHDRRVCIMYANFKAQHDGVLEFGLHPLLRQGRADRERAGARQDFLAAAAARANPCRRRHRHRRAGQDREGARRARQDDHVRRCRVC